ncbi:MAG: antibiotic biosynthesis monooxygenase [Lewinellaceae bacterium]|nr:antibiotic biosynthesis monooxygenase [Lewinellaceae bacterium]
MIKRIVKMRFREDAVQTFIGEVFEESKDAIRAFPGCQHMELLQHTQSNTTLFTLSIWDDEAALDRYRNSPLFKQTWARTKALFEDRAEAWSVEVLDVPKP